MSDRAHPKVRRSALLLSALVLSPDDDLEGYRKHRVADGALDLDGLGLSDDAVRLLLSVDAEGWKQELPSMAKHFDSFGDKMPQGLREELEALRERLG